MMKMLIMMMMVVMMIVELLMVAVMIVTLLRLLMLLMLMVMMVAVMMMMMMRPYDKELDTDEDNYHKDDRYYVFCAALGAGAAPSSRFLILVLGSWSI